jgi:hypothetical protein
MYYRLFKGMATSIFENRISLTKASSLARAAEVTCKAGDTPLPSSNAQAAIELLR